MVKRATSLAVVALLVSGGLAAAEESLNLNRALVREGRRLIEYAKKQKYENVGVLKFLVKKGKGPLTDRAGTLNLDLARRLELALILGLDVAEPVGIIKNASAVAARLQRQKKNVSHLTEEGRKPLFDVEYPLAWGGKKEKADAFFSGEAQLSDDLKTIKVVLRCYDKKGDKEVGRFEAKTVADDLVQSGESFLLRTVVRRDRTLRVVKKDATVYADEVKNGKKPHPLLIQKNSDLNVAPPPLVDLEIWYDDKLIEPKFDKNRGTVTIPEPEEGQKVKFVLKRTKAAGDERLGVVLRVNGENSLFREKGKSDLHSSKWILKPTETSLPVKGFQIDADTDEEFTGLSSEESKVQENKVDYDEKLGTISMVVFQVKEGIEKNTLTDEQIDARLERGDYPEKLSKNAQALQNQIKISTPLRRGLIGSGKAGRSKVTEDPSFEAEKVPVESVHITYYKPRR
jgi:hypothetical protein